MISRFFIDRPVLASVLSIVIVLAGLVSMRVLAIAQYPQIVPPEVVVTASYPGATAQTIAETVAAPLEQQINGVERMLYMRSTSTDSGTMRLTVTFEIGTNSDQATINVSNRVQRAAPFLPIEVNRQGVTVQKRSSTILQLVTMSSPAGRYDTIFIGNYALVNVIDELRRLPGVGDASLFGASDYSMRIWVRPDKVAQYNLAIGDIAAAIREQNAQFAAGRFGEEPMPGAEPFTYSVSTPGRLIDTREFENIILRSDEKGAALRLKDVARVELGALNYAFSATYNGAPAVPIGIYLQPDANALEVAAAVRQTMDRLAQRFPEGLTEADADARTGQTRRTLLLGALATSACLGCSPQVRAGEDPPGSDERPRKGDLLVFSEGDNEGKLITAADVPAGGPPVHAWPKDPNTSVVRSASRLNEILIIRLDPAELDEKTRARAVDGIIAYSAICSHAGCPVTAWVKSDVGDKEVFKCMCHNSEYDPRSGAQVVFGPAPRRLAALPLALADGSLSVAGNFMGKVGGAQPG